MSSSEMFTKLLVAGFLVFILIYRGNRPVCPGVPGELALYESSAEAVGRLYLNLGRRRILQLVMEYVGEIGPVVVVL